MYKVTLLVESIFVILIYFTSDFTKEPAVCCASESTNFNISTPEPLNVVEIVSIFLVIWLTPDIVLTFDVDSILLLGSLICSCKVTVRSAIDNFIINITRV